MSKAQLKNRKMARRFPAKTVTVPKTVTVSNFLTQVTPPKMFTAMYDLTRCPVCSQGGDDKCITVTGKLAKSNHKSRPAVEV